MKFEIYRSLKNKVFTTAIKRIVDKNDDDELAELEFETKLIDDLGPIEIETGKKFVGFIKKDGDKFVLDKAATEKTEDNVELKFILDSNIVAIDQKAVITFSCDAKEEVPFKFSSTETIPALRLAEIKCEMFEAGINARIEKAVNEVLAEATDFEDTVPAGSFSVALLKKEEVTE